MNDYVELHRQFRDLTDKEREDPGLLAIFGDGDIPSGSPWSELLQSERIVLLAEAGSGKTREMQEQVRRLTAEGHPAFFVPLETLEDEDVRGYLAMEPGEDVRFDAWLASDQPGWIFLDAVDELKLVNGKIEKALGKLVRALGAARSRARILISCRPTDWRPVQDMDVFRTKFPTSDPQLTPPGASSDDAFLVPFREKEQTSTAPAGKPIEKFRCVVLLPLGKRQIEAFATALDVSNPKKLLAEIRKHEAWGFARRPLDLRGLIATWNTQSRLGTRRQQHETDIDNSLRDAPDRADQGVLSLDQAKQGAERLALAMSLTKTRTIRAPEQVGLESTDSSSLDATEVLSNWTEAQVKTLLRRPIFDPATYGRVRFHHRSVQEFLAARHLLALRTKGLTTRQLLSLCFADTYGEKIVIPSMRPVAAWLSKDNPDTCREVLRREPEVLILHGDPETLSLPVRSDLIRSYVDAYGGGDWRGLHMPIAEAQRLAKPDLAPVIRQAWNRKSSNEEIADLLLKLIWLGGIEDCSDIAFTASMDASLGPYARNLAMRALGECKRIDLLRRIATDMLAKPKRWQDRVVYSIGDELFPAVISVAELERLLVRTKEPTRSVGGFSWTLYNLADKLMPRDKHAIALRDLLAKLVWNGRDTNSEAYHPKSKYSYFTPALAKLCVRQWNAGARPSTALIRASAIANRFHGDNVVGRDEIKELPNIIAKQTVSREALFWGDYRVLEGLKGDVSRILFFQILRGGLLSKLDPSDWDWLMRGLKQGEPRAREVSLYALLDLWYERGKAEPDLEILKRATAKDAAFSEIVVHQTTPAPPNPQMEKYNADHQRYVEARASEQRRVEASWATWKRKADADPKACFVGKAAEPSMWTLLKWLRYYPGSGSRIAHDNWRSVRDVLGGVIGNGFEAKVRDYWRKTNPPVWSGRKESKRDTVFSSQEAALTGLLVEAHTAPDWASHLSDAEARRAAGWALTEMNGAPEWLDVLAASHPAQVRATLEKELKAEFDEINELVHPRTLNAMRYGEDRVRRLAAPFIRRSVLNWPTAPSEAAQKNVSGLNLDAALSVIMAAMLGDGDVADLCERRLLAQPDGVTATIWLRGLCACDLRRGIRVLRKALGKVPKARQTPLAIGWIGSLFGDHDRYRVQVPLTADANILLELVRLAYSRVRPNDDVEAGNSDEVEPRDEAQFARNHLLNALIEKPGAEAHRALLDLTHEPAFLHMADRLVLMARERAANDSEPRPLTVQEYRVWEERFETAPATRDQLYQVMLDRLDDIAHDIRDHDFSDRATLAKVKRETEIQPLLAKKFSDNARGQYQVVREDEVADKKETDIRLLAGVSDQRAVIEVKIGDNWNVRQLESALRAQLLGQYLRHSSCTAGCLLVTYAGRKAFHGPKSRKALSFEAVIDRLRALAARLENTENGRIRVTVVGLDLRPPLTNAEAGEKATPRRRPSARKRRSTPSRRRSSSGQRQ